MGEVCLSLFFGLTAWAMLRSRAYPRWAAIGGLAVSALGLVAALRNVTTVVAPIASLDNLVLPVWLVVLGLVLVRRRRPAIYGTSTAPAVQPSALRGLPS